MDKYSKGGGLNSQRSSPAGLYAFLTFGLCTDGMPNSKRCMRMKITKECQCENASASHPMRQSKPVQGSAHFKKKETIRSMKYVPQARGTGGREETQHVTALHVQTCSVSTEP